MDKESALFMLDIILDGIDRDECDKDEGGWWETSTGVNLGKKRKEMIIKLIDKIYSGKEK